MRELQIDEAPGRARDAALIIHDPKTFRARLAAAVNQKHPRAILKESPLRYYDPYTIRRDQLVPIFSKNFRYTYQNEYRMSWIVQDSEPLQPFFVELGALADLASVVELA